MTQMFLDFSLLVEVSFFVWVWSICLDHSNPHSILHPHPHPRKQQQGELLDQIEYNVAKS
jgi:hypothetical protein